MQTALSGPWDDRPLRGPSCDLLGLAVYGFEQEMQRRQRRSEQPPQRQVRLHPATQPSSPLRPFPREERRALPDRSDVREAHS
jgi:hypothetical protein